MCHGVIDFNFQVSIGYFGKTQKKVGEAAT